MNKASQSKRGYSLLACGIVCIMILAVALCLYQNSFSSAVKFNTESDFIEFLDVGQGDCALIYSNGYSALIDVGEPEHAPTLRKALSDYGIKQLDAVIISHLHSDHVGALPEIADLYPIDNLFMPALKNNSIIAAKAGQQEAIKNGSAFYEARAGINFNIGEFEITLLSDFEDNDNENNRSVFVMAKTDDTRILFTGDAEAKTESLLLKEGINIDCDILKVGHHGSNTSSSKRFLKYASPDYAVISVGKNNSYRHPHDTTLSSLKRNGAEILRTDYNGDITFDFTSDRLEIKAEK